MESLQESPCSCGPHMTQIFSYRPGLTSYISVHWHTFKLVLLLGSMFWVHHCIAKSKSWLENIPVNSSRHPTSCIVWKQRTSPLIVCHVQQPAALPLLQGPCLLTGASFNLCRERALYHTSWHTETSYNFGTVIGGCFKETAHYIFG